MNRLPHLFIVLGILATSTQGQEQALTDSLGIELKLVPAGKYLRGYNGYRRDIAAEFGKDHVGMLHRGETPPHVTFISRPFYLGTKEVTVAQFRRFVEDSGYVTTVEKHGEGIVGWHNVLDHPDQRQKRRFRQLPKFTWKNPGFEQGDDHPVVGVSWNDAQAFCKWLSEKEGANYRLPTEAEWEHACRAGSPTFFCFGDSHRGKLSQFANHADHDLEQAYENTATQRWYPTTDGDGAVFTSAVGSYQPNDWGFHDMHGNVWELCQDVFLDTFYNHWKRPNNNVPNGFAVDPVNLSETWNDAGNWRAIRGGSWINAPVKCRAGFRGFYEANDGACYLGFRVARNAEGPVVDAALAKHETYLAAWDATHAMPIKWSTAYYADMTLKMEIQRDTPAEIDNLLPLMTRVTDIHLSPSGGMRPELMEALGKMTWLRRLNIYFPGRHIAPEGFAPLVNLDQLEQLSFGGAISITPEVLSRFTCLENLTQLSLGNDQITSADMAALAGKSWPNLTHLHLSQIQSDGSELEHFAGAPLVQVTLKTLTDDGAKQLGRFTTLTDVRIGEPRITGSGLAELVGLKNLKSLSLTNLKTLTDADFAPIANLTGLETVALQGSGAGDLTAALLAKLPRLRNLHIGSPALTDEGMRHVGNISTLSYRLEIGADSAITDAGLKHLWAADRVTYFQLRPPTGITGSGLGSLAENMIGLHDIEIYSGDFEDIGLRYLGYLPKLRMLRLFGSQGAGLSKITRQGLLDLAEAPGLQQLEIRGPNIQITDADIAAVKEKLPNLNVTITKS